MLQNKDFSSVIYWGNVRKVFSDLIFNQISQHENVEDIEAHDFLHLSSRISYRRIQ